MQDESIRWLRVEGAAVVITSLFLYAQFGKSWILFAALFLVPDVSMLGYLANKRVGAVAYNLAHTYAASLLTATFAVALNAPILMAVALIWTAHIGFDRALGYGLKHSTGFKHTHLGALG